MMTEVKTTNNKRRFAIITCAIIIVVIAVVGIWVVNQDDEEHKIPAFKVETPFIELEYPSRWQENLNVEWSGSVVAGRVIFSAKIEEKEEKILSMIHFNEEAQTSLGVLNTDNDEISVGVSLVELQFDENWSTEEQDIIYAMQEDINYTIEQLLKNKEFKKQ